ncbi:MAG: hypothetical protein M3313_10345 [Actinomycetota bacterium]|nr:hypothetical protein [Actinomycetota bacterium]
MTEDVSNDRTTVRRSEQRSAVFGALIDLTTLVILLQGVWAGIFLQRDAARTD